jgi:hypothetical protein
VLTAVGEPATVTGLPFDFPLFPAASAPAFALFPVGPFGTGFGGTPLSTVFGNPLANPGG